MSAVEIAAEAIWRTDPFRMGDPNTWLGEGDQAEYLSMAASALDAVKRSGFAIVELPAGDDHGRFQSMTDSVNKVWGDVGAFHGRRVCTGIPDCDFTWRTPESARSFAAALLAAADVAECA
jgi:hypothetical protein